MWEEFLARCTERTFLQSWSWGEFQGRMGNKIWRLGVFQGTELVALALVIKVIARRGIFLMIPHGPVLKVLEAQLQTSKEEIVRLLVEELKQVAAREGASFLRVAPLWQRTEEYRKVLQEIGFRQASMHGNAYEATWKLDIRDSEEELFKNMRKTTRYLIRQGLNNPEITIEKSENAKEAEIFSKLSQEIARHQHFTPFSFEFIKNEFEVFYKEKGALWIWGLYRGEIVAGALIIFWSQIGFYHQAVSKVAYAKFSLPYLVQWEAIREAKRRGCTLYDFWGYVNPKTHPSHPWAGPALFKMGFGGKACEYIRTQDLPLSWRYLPTAIFERIRRIRRHL